MKILIITVIILIIQQACGDEFDNYKKKFSKKYLDKKEEEQRRKIFKKNSNLIKKLNSDYKNGLKPYKVSENNFVDLSFDEIISKYTGRNAMRAPQALFNKASLAPRSSSKKALPSFVDWRNVSGKSFVTPVKNQGSCGCCWAFSVTGAMEGQYARKTGKLAWFSEQQLVDCNYDLDYGNFGCFGGFEEIAFDYVTANGIMRSSDYKFQALQNTMCLFDQSRAVAKFGSYVAIPVNETDLKQAVATIGPISIAVHINTDFLYYSEGVFTTTDCKNDYYSLNHAVLVVGYGTDKATGLDYWLVKNSWGTNWGENGYIRMRRNFGNMCGIASNGLYALMI